MLIIKELPIIKKSFLEAFVAEIKKVVGTPYCPGVTTDVLN